MFEHGHCICNLGSFPIFSAVFALGRFCCLIENFGAPHCPQRSHLHFVLGNSGFLRSLKLVFIKTFLVVGSFCLTAFPSFEWFILLRRSFMLPCEKSDNVRIFALSIFFANSQLLADLLIRAETFGAGVEFAVFLGQYVYDCFVFVLCNTK